MLIILLVVIWGAVIYKYFGKSGGMNDDIDHDLTGANYKPKYIITKDTFLLELINKAPFKTSKIVRKKVAQTKPKVAVIKKKVKPVKKSNLVWPTISYHGFVKGKNKSTRLILLKINKRLYRKRENETIDNLTLIKAYSDSLIVSFNRTKKTIQKIHD